MAKLAETGRFAIAGLAITLLSGCANDLIIDLGKGDEIRLVGQGDNFDCNDPAYAKVNKVTTFHLVFHDGTKTLCRDADLPPPTIPAMKAYSASTSTFTTPQSNLPAAPSAGSIQTRPLPPGSAASISNGGIDNR